MFNSEQKRAFLAVLLSGIVLFGWQMYFAPKTPTDSNKGQTKSTSEVVKEPVAKSGDSKLEQTATVAVTPQLVEQKNVLENFVLSHNGFEFKLNNDLTVTEMKNPNSVFSFYSLSESQIPLKIQIVTENGPLSLMFNLVQEGPNKISGSNAQYGINLSATILDNGRVNFSMNSDRANKLRFIFEGKQKKSDNGQIRHFLIYSSDLKTISTGSDKDGDGVLKWFGVDFNYHLFAMVLKDKVAAKYLTTEKGEMIIDIPEASKNFSADLVFTKKNYDILVGLGDNLHLAVDFGFFAILAVPILRGLQFIHNYIPNYGIAIILLTILIRLITFPLQYKSFKSMKKMQAIQPELNAIKEKYKDEPQKMQKETMDLFKKAGANPLSGCLPLLLQMPFFFAIYRVLYSAVELVGAPFFGWIHDLSIHDPFYVLPVLMGVSMFAQQKLTPQTSMDPTQQKIMMLMPLIFAFIMKSLPAGLVLYILVSTVVGILQQMLVYKMAD